MSTQEPAATGPRWNSESAERWLSRVDALESSMVPIRDLLMERAKLHAGERVLDVGCGSGPSTAAAAKAVRPDGMVTGIDIAPSMIAAASQRVRDPEIEWIVGDAELYPLPDAQYDAIISQMGLMFFTNNARAFANLARACRSGGRLVAIAWPTRDKVSMFTFMFNSVRRTLDRLGIQYQEPPLDFGPFSLGDARYVERLLSENGWNDVRVEQVERPLIMVEPRTSLNQESAVEWLRTGPVNTLLAGQPEDAYAEAASDWLQVMKERSADQELRFDVLLHVISAKHL